MVSNTCIQELQKVFIVFSLAEIASTVFECIYGSHPTEINLRSKYMSFLNLFNFDNPYEKWSEIGENYDKFLQKTSYWLKQRKYD